MPLEAGNLGDLNEQPLAGNVLEAGLDDAQLHSACVWHQCDEQAQRFANVETYHWGEQGPSTGGWHASHGSHAKSSLQSR